MRLLLLFLFLWLPPIPREAPGWDRIPRPTAVVHKQVAPVSSPEVVAQPTPRVEYRQTVVAIIDTGVDCNHPQLYNRCVLGRSFVDGVENDVAVDVVGHGTQVAGIITARSNALIMPIRLADFNRPHFTPEDISKAIVWATDNSANIINTSFGSSIDYQVVRQSVEYACARGVRIVAAAGNHGTNLIMYPAGYPCVIAVGALDTSGKRAVMETWASGYGSHINYWRYGIDLDTTVPTYNIIQSSFSGTSAAAAVVSAEMANR